MDDVTINNQINAIKCLVQELQKNILNIWTYCLLIDLTVWQEQKERKCDLDNQSEWD